MHTAILSTCTFGDYDHGVATPHVPVVDWSAVLP
jgi:hypothetical protein